MQAALKGIPIVSVIEGLAKYHGKRYCYPSQIKIMELLKQRMGIEISIATLNRYLRVIEDRGWIKRTRRIRRDKVFGMMFLSTLYVVTKKGYGLLSRLGMRVWEKVKKKSGEKEERRRDEGVIVYDDEKRKFVLKKKPT